MAVERIPGVHSQPWWRHEPPGSGSTLNLGRCPKFQGCDYGCGARGTHVVLLWTVWRWEI